MSLLDSVIGLIAPPACVICEIEGSTLCVACSNTEIVPYGERCFGCGVVSPGGRTCERCRPGAPRYVWVSTNYENAARELVKVYKFGHQRAAADSLANIMVATLLDFNYSETLQSLNYLVVSVPTATSRVRRRSFDHSALLTRQIARRLNLKYMNALIRLGQTRQLGAARSVRLTQPEGKYLVRYPNLLSGKNILLIDDVVTTGATIRAATKALRAAGAARVDAVVFAKRL
ncbi:MAG TPA: phosphoribosyltransferase family protein [Candidatus Saccharimonadales bacterium]|nr:phosphoribosyltransferase family protein [Candidatus Saccharimonadales bacterium]